MQIQVKETELVVMDELRKLNEDFVRMFVVEEATALRNLHEENSGLHQRNDLLVNKPRLSENELISKALCENENSFTIALVHGHSQIKRGAYA